VQVKLPVTVTEYEPGIEELKVQDAATVPPDDRLTLTGQVVETAEGGGAVRLIVPESPKRLVIVMIPVVEDPVGNETAAAFIAKSVTLTFRVTEWVKEPIDPVMETV
jgi:hypothetical protein